MQGYLIIRCNVLVQLFLLIYSEIITICERILTMKENFLESELPKGLSKPAIRALANAGITDLEQLTKISEAELLKLHGMGPKAIELIRKTLSEKELSFLE